MTHWEKITYEILAEQKLHYFESKKLVGWAVKVLLLGQESENLYILAGLDNDTTEKREKYFLKSLNDLKFENKKSDKELVEIYAENLAKKVVNGEIDINVALKKMLRVVGFSDYDSKYIDFEWISEDLYNLKYEHFTIYCSGMTLENYKEYILEEFEIFLEMQDLKIPDEERTKNYCSNCKKFTKLKIKTKYQLFKKPFKINVMCCEFCKSEKLKYSYNP
jgi:hypothetical protein